MLNEKMISNFLHWEEPTISIDLDGTEFSEFNFEITANTIEVTCYGPKNTHRIELNTSELLEQITAVLKAGGK